MHKFFLFLILFSVQLTVNSEPDDPFNVDSAPADPFSSEFSQEQNDQAVDLHDFRVELKSYYQKNQIRENHPFSPLNVDSPLFDQSIQYVGLDVDWQTTMSSQWRSRVRVFNRYLAGSSNTYLAEGASRPAKLKSWLLEGVAHWQSSDQRFSFELGRNKPQWSNGYSYDIANLLLPQRSRPFTDQDDPLQSKGWDMLNFRYINDKWSFSGYLVDSVSAYFNKNVEMVLRLGYQDDNAASLLLHKIEGEQLAWAATWSSLLSDNMSLRAEWSAHPYRQLAIENNHSRNYYQRFVIGSNYTDDAGWSFLMEYFYNQHGATNEEWSQVSQAAAVAAEMVKSGLSNNFPEDINKAFSGLGITREGWLRKNYISLLWTSEETENFWQFRFNSLLNLDDDSKMYRVEALKSFNDNFSTRLQFEYFVGCQLCEYALTPNKNTIRLVANWLF